jgi:hypothetical protein
MRVIASKIPSIAELQLPPAVAGTDVPDEDSLITR